MYAQLKFAKHVYIYIYLLLSVAHTHLYTADTLTGTRKFKNKFSPLKSTKIAIFRAIAARAHRTDSYENVYSTKTVVEYIRAWATSTSARISLSLSFPLIYVFLYAFRFGSDVYFAEFKSISHAHIHTHTQVCVWIYSVASFNG